MSPLPARLRDANARLVGALDALVRLLERRRRARSVLAVLMASFSALVIGSLCASAAAAHHRWSAGTAVLVANGPVAAGVALDATNTRIITLPPALAPLDALAAPPPGSVMRIAVETGTPLTASLVDTGSSAPIPEGWRVVAVAEGTGAPALDAGDVVDIVSLDAIIAAGAVVVESRDRHAVSVAVSPTDVAVVATAMHSGDASLVLARRPG